MSDFRGMKRSVVLAAVCLAVAASAANATTMKEFRPGDVRACGVDRCIAIRSQRVLDALARFYYGSPAPTRASVPAKRAPYLRLVYRDGYVTGVAVGTRFTRFLSFGVNLGQFAARRWYAVPGPVAADLRRLGTNISTARLPKNILSRSH
jgi:hypothetical protein